MGTYTLFIAKAPGIMDALKRDFGFSTVQAAAILGNLGHECDGFRTLQEISPVAGRGGYGWAQWTGPRRRAFEAWCDNRDLDVDSDEANYGFLKREFSTTHDYAVRALRQETDLVRAVRVFERKYLVAGVPHYPSRERYAEIALDAYRSADRISVEALEAAGAGEAEWLDSGLETLERGGAAVAARPRVSAGAFHDPDCDCSSVSRLKRGPLLETVAPSLDPVTTLAAGPAKGMLTVAPTIHDTVSWDARPPKAPITVLNRRPKGIVIHHTASQNVSDMSLAHAKQLARTIQDFHMGPRRNWIDTGQHFTISRGGYILEGRHRSLEMARGGQRHVLGAHAGSACNADYVGIENEGTYTNGLPPATQWTALVQLSAWLCNQYGMSPDDIIGHRQCKDTDCPGDRFFARLDELRRDVAAAR